MMVAGKRNDRPRLTEPDHGSETESFCFLLLLSKRLDSYPNFVSPLLARVICLPFSVSGISLKRCVIPFDIDGTWKSFPGASEIGCWILLSWRKPCFAIVLGILFADCE